MTLSEFDGHFCCVSDQTFHAVFLHHQSLLFGTGVGGEPDGELADPGSPVKMDI